ncbi:MAG TPA: hypothetical protein VKB27_04275 [Gammaproteobacteria bacterium]|nr:hypothetical protein [Gammaproteobacteria bacterium]
MRGVNSVIGLAALLLVMLVAGPTARAQQSTERFIPIGFSPGVSNVSSYIGAVTAVDDSAQTFSLQADGETRTLRVSAETLIWLDRSKVRKTNIDAGFADIQPGRVIEVRYDAENPQMAVWVKIQSS